MTASHPILGFIACFLYVGVSAATLSARRASDIKSDRLRWTIFTIFFLVLAFLRGSGLEFAATSAMREWLLQDGLYNQRRELQRPLAALAVILISFTLALFYHKRPRGNWNSPASAGVWAIFSATVGVTLMCGLVMMRLISLHDLDRYLYGTVRLNWIMDIGSSILVALAAIYFRRSSRS